MSLYSSILKKLDGVKAELYHFPTSEELMADQAADEKPDDEPQEPACAPLENRPVEQSVDSFEDVFDYASVQTDAILEDARKQAEKIRVNAYASIQPELDKLRQNARDEGYNDGYAAGMEDATAEGKAKLEKQSAALDAEVRAFLEQATKTQLSVVDQAKDDMRDLAIAVAEKVIQVSLQSSSAVIAKMIQRATEKLKRREWVRIYIGGCASREIAQMTPQLMSALSTLSDHIRVVPLSGEERGTCIIEMPDTIIDASASTQMENIREIVSDIPVEDQQRPDFSGLRFTNQD